MRMRKKKNSESRLLLCKEFLYSHEGEALSRPSRVFGKPEGEVYLEIGAGKGGFACEMARRNKDVSYFAMERVTDCVVICAERASSGEYGELSNLKFLIKNADDLLTVFAPGSIDRIFLNFSDPWPKKGYAKRRLTHRRYLALYMNLLREGGVLRFKTDNEGLFDFSLSEIEALGLKCDIVTRDLHASPYNEGNVVTEYEKNFTDMGMKINMLEVRRPSGFSPEIPIEFTDRDRISRYKK